ncbi:MAG: hypothetical protein ACK4UN_14555 [Limisphaerales bacterium]
MFKSPKLVFVFGIPIGLCIWILFISLNNRKSAPKVIIPVQDLQRSEAIWQSQEFISIHDSAVIEETIDRLVSSSTMEEKQRVAAKSSIVNLLFGFGTPNWSRFREFRFPSDNFRLTLPTEEYLKEQCPNIVAVGGVTGCYETLWKQTFQNPLWTEVAFTSLSLTITNSSKGVDFYLPFPEYTASTNRNWMEQGLPASLSYSHRFDNVNEIALLSLFFFAGLKDSDNHVERRPFMFTLGWDPEQNVWLPLRFQHQFVRQPAHKIVLF